MTTIELTSTGQLSQLLQRHPSEISVAVAALEITPSYRLNNVSYFSTQDCQRLVEFFRRRAEEASI